MKMHRFIGEFDFNKNILEIKDERIVNQVIKVLRMAKGDFFIICDGHGRQAKATILTLEKHRISVKIGKVENNLPVRKPETVLYCAVLKRENFELVVQKVTEIGVKTIVPILSQRTVKQKLKLERLKLIALEAAEQSGRGEVPEVLEPMRWDQAVKHASENQKNIFYHTRETVADAKLSKDVKKIGVWIGPEGGWSNEEVAEAKKLEWTIMSLGDLILRAETAAIVASYFAAKL